MTNDSVFWRRQEGMEQRLTLTRRRVMSGRKEEGVRLISTEIEEGQKGIHSKYRGSQRLSYEDGRM